jgi:hypothetical protein
MSIVIVENAINIRVARKKLPQGADPARREIRDRTTRRRRAVHGSESAGRLADRGAEPLYGS